MKISISALSIAYGLTPEALRYYEEKGLLTPERTSSGGFRRFSVVDIQMLGIIKSLQRQGFSLDEIRRIVKTGLPLSDLIAMMDDKRAQLSEQMAMVNAIRNRLTSCTDLLRDHELLLMQPRICQGSAAYLVDFDSVSALWQSVSTSPLIKDLIDALPLSSYSTIVPLLRLQGEDTPTRTGICAPAEFAALIHADFSQMRMSAGPRCVRMLFDLQPPARTAMTPVITKMQAYLRENRLTPAAEGYTRQFSWHVDENGQQRQFSELIVPIL
ncbi:MAG: MerR family transcriptional regulator [Clostridiales bacterium]|nr:MerR family transcriptional regulator [Clostridiales bacterium]